MAKRKTAPKEKSSNRTMSGFLIALSVIVIVALFGGGGKGKSSSSPTSGITLYAPTPVTEVAQAIPATAAPTDQPTVTAIKLAARNVTVEPSATITDTPESAIAGESSDTNFFQYAQVRTMYVNKSGNVNARSCPRTTCSILARLAGYSAIPVEGETTGELVNNNT